MAPPSIVDYRPRSTLVVPQHPVRRPRFPAIDYHGHPGNEYLTSAEGLERLGDAIDSIGLKVIVVANNGSGVALKSQIERVRASARMKDRVRFLAGIDFRNVGPNWAAAAVAQLDADVAAGAIGIGEIPKSFGMSIRKADGSRLRLDDHDLDRVWAEAARLGIPVFIHVGDPQEFWQPIDAHNERWLELALFPDRRYPADQYPPFQELAAERDNLIRQNPQTTFIVAHLGWQANDLASVAKLMDQFPNFYSELGAVLYDIGRQPRGAREFLIKYQDRLLFGKDAFQPEEYPYYWRVFETADEYFDYYRGYHAFWKLYGLELPDEVLKKIYYGNAKKLAKGLP
jgi:predicted TIM-barrel fold metal-dependent hydrolase